MKRNGEPNWQVASLMVTQGAWRSAKATKLVLRQGPNAKEVAINMVKERDLEPKKLASELISLPAWTLVEAAKWCYKENATTPPHSLKYGCSGDGHLMIKWPQFSITTMAVIRPRSSSSGAAGGAPKSRTGKWQ